MFVIFKDELKFYFKSMREVIQLASLFISIAVLMPFIDEVTADHSLTTSILWISLILGVNSTATRMFQRDRESGRLECYQTMKKSMEAIVFSKWLALYVAMMLPLILVLPCIGLLLSIAAGEWAGYAAALGIGALPLSLIAALSSVLMAGEQRSAAWLSLISLPISIPVIIFGSSYMQSLTGLTHEDNMMMAVFLVGYSVFLLPIVCIAGASCIKSFN